MYHSLSLCHLLAVLLLAAARSPQIKVSPCREYPGSGMRGERAVKSLEAASALPRPLPVGFRRSQMKSPPCCDD